MLNISSFAIIPANDFSFLILLFAQFINVKEWMTTMFFIISKKRKEKMFAKMCYEIHLYQDLGLFVF